MREIEGEYPITRGRREDQTLKIGDEGLKRSCRRKQPNCVSKRPVKMYHILTTIVRLPSSATKLNSSRSNSL